MPENKHISRLDFLTSVILLVLLSFLLLFHFLVITGLVPFEIIWGGKLNNHSQMLTYESVSLIINLLMILVVAVNAGFINFKVKRIIVIVSLWIMFFLFLLNTAGNFSSQNQFERSVFGPLTLVISLLCLNLSLTASRNFSKGLY